MLTSLSHPCVKCSLALETIVDKKLLLNILDMRGMVYKSSSSVLLCLYFGGKNYEIRGLKLAPINLALLKDREEN